MEGIHLLKNLRKITINKELSKKGEIKKLQKNNNKLELKIQTDYFIVINKGKKN
jgi:hypothetical protein